MPPETVFWGLTRLFGVFFLWVIYRLAFKATHQHRISLMIMLLIGSYPASLKIPLYFSSLIDIEAFPPFGLSMELLLRDWWFTAGLFAAMGLSVKEFLGVLWLLALIQLARARCWGQSAILLGAGVAMIVGIRIRIGIPVKASAQFLDPLQRAS